jgi:tripartite-type tricarboxylate transporter receptor subunit TctC
MRRNLLLSALCACTFLQCSDGVAQTGGYPSRHVSIISQVAAGSGPDVVARVVADRLAHTWGKQVAIINRQGAAGLLAAQAAVAAPADGYTLFLPTVSGLIIAPEIQPKFPVDFERDFASIGIVGETPMVIAVSPALGVNTLAEFIALAKKKPGELTFAGNNRGSFPHLAGQLLQGRAEIQLTFVSYPGAAAALNDVMGGRIAMMVESPSALAGAISNGSLKPLAVSSAARLPNFPTLPTVAETLPGLVATGWFALLTPIGTPVPIIHKVSDDLRDVLLQPAVKERFATLGVDARPMSPAETAEFIRNERRLWKPVIERAGLLAQ